MASGSGWRGLRPARKSFLGDVSGLVFPLGVAVCTVVEDREIKGLAEEGMGGPGLDTFSTISPLLSVVSGFFVASLIDFSRDRTVDAGPNDVAKPPKGADFVVSPIAGDRIRPPMLTVCLCSDVFGRVDSVALLCLALLISAIQLGCEGAAAGFGFGESGLFSALSSQLDFVGLHLPEAFVGLRDLPRIEPPPRSLASDSDIVDESRGDRMVAP